MHPVCLWLEVSGGRCRPTVRSLCITFLCVGLRCWSEPVAVELSGTYRGTCQDQRQARSANLPFQSRLAWAAHFSLGRDGTRRDESDFLTRLRGTSSPTKRYFLPSAIALAALSIQQDLTTKLNRSGSSHGPVVFISVCPGQASAGWTTPIWYIYSPYSTLFVPDEEALTSISTKMHLYRLEANARLGNLLRFTMMRKTKRMRMRTICSYHRNAARERRPQPPRTRTRQRHLVLYPRNVRSVTRLQTALPEKVRMVRRRTA